MTHSIDLRAIGYGLATFVLGYFLLAVATTLAANSSGTEFSRVLRLLVTVGAGVVPLVAGYISAYHARSRHILHGTIGGSLGVALLIIAAALFVPAYPAWGVPLLIAIFALIAWLGAIIGNHRQGKVGP